MVGVHVPDSQLFGEFRVPAEVLCIVGLVGVERLRIRLVGPRAIRVAAVVQKSNRKGGRADEAVPGSSFQPASTRLTAATTGLCLMRNANIAAAHVEGLCD